MGITAKQGNSDWVKNKISLCGSWPISDLPDSFLATSSIVRRSPWFICGHPITRPSKPKKNVVFEGHHGSPLSKRLMHKYVVHFVRLLFSSDEIMNTALKAKAEPVIVNFGSLVSARVRCLY